MNPCKWYEEDLALLAGGDLPVDGTPRSVDLSLHVAGCPSCADLLQGLRSDQTALARLASSELAGSEAAPASTSQGGSSLVASLVPALADQLAAARDGAVEAPRVRPGRDRVPASLLPVAGRQARGPAYGMLAAGLGIAALAGILAVSRLGGSLGSHGLAVGSSTGAAAAPEAPVSVASVAGPGLPVRVTRAAGDGIALEWQGDGRERAPGAATTYHVLASASARDFSDARRVEVAGSRFIATMDLPARAAGQGRVTYFRVQ